MSIQCDVLVAGGGSAGVAAAVSAARSGAKTILIEKNGSLGGIVSSSLVHSICGLYLPSLNNRGDARPPAVTTELLRLGEEPEPVFANPGFASEFASRLLASGGATGPVRMGRVDVLLQQPTAFCRLCNSFVLETGNLEVRLHTVMTETAVNRSIASVGILCGGLRETIFPRTVIDASGDAVVAVLAGAEFEMENPSRLQRPAIIFALQGVEPFALEDDARLKIAGRLVSAVRNGRLPVGALGASLRGAGCPGGAFVTVDLDVPSGMEYNPCNPKCLTAMEMHGRSLAWEFTAFLQQELDGFHGCILSTLPASIGVRESRRITGLAYVGAQDILVGTQFEDSVAQAAWPMELREQPTGPRFRFPENGRSCGVPLGAFRSKSLDILFMAGRCISSSHEAQASLRVIGTCLATGEAAGIAAALLASGKQCNASAVRDARRNLPVK